MSAVVECCQERVRFDGAGGKLEGQFAYPVEGDPTFSALVAGPHPLLGGDMNNNLVRALREGLAAAGAAVLTFNYGGVGGSDGGPADWPAVVSRFWQDGCFDEQRDWVEDTASALRALRSWCDRPLVLLGYSFGCWAVAQQVNGRDARVMVLISPNPSRHRFDALEASATPLRVIHSDNDFECAPDALVRWFDTLRPPKSRILLHAGEHFFRGHEAGVVESALSFVRELLGAEVVAR